MAEAAPYPIIACPHEEIPVEVWIAALDFLEGSSEYFGVMFLSEIAHDDASHMDESSAKIATQWLRFFNNLYYNNPQLYQAITMMCLTMAYERNFFPQTAYAFEKSKAFFRALFSATQCWQIRTMEEADAIWKIGLAAGTHHHRVSPVEPVLESLRYRLDETEISKMFQGLFVQYEAPHCWMSHLEFLDHKEMAWLIQVCQGESLRKLPDLPMPLSRKEQHALLHLKGHAKFESNVVERLMVLAKLKAGGVSDRVISEVVPVAHSFTEAFDFWKLYVHFWTHFLIKVEYDDLGRENTRIGDLMDYAVYFIRDHGYPPHLKGREYEHLHRACVEWHNALNYGNEPTEELFWEPQYDGAILIPDQDRTYQFKELTSSQALHEESEFMHHCVADYAGRCHRGHIHIWSMKLIHESSSRYRLTIEISQNFNVVQVSGAFNRDPLQEERRVIQKWKQLLVEHCGQPMDKV